MSVLPEFEDPMARPRYTGLATFMRAPYREDPAGVDIGLIGVPFDGGVTNRTGTRHGPREIRNQSSLMRKINQASGIAPYELCTVADLGDAWVQRPFHLESSLEEIRGFLSSASMPPASCRSAPGAIIRSRCRSCARSPPSGRSAWSTSTPIATPAPTISAPTTITARRSRARSRRACSIPRRTVQIGIRGGVNDRDVWKFSHESGMRVIYMPEFHEMGLEAAIAEARRVVGDGPTYVSFDIDSLDPAYAPGTGTPEVGGFTSREAQLMIRKLRGLDLVGADVVEVSPPFDPSGLTALTGASMMFELLVRARRCRRGPRVSRLGSPPRAGAHRDRAAACAASCSVGLLVAAARRRRRSFWSTASCRCRSRRSW